MGFICLWNMYRLYIAWYRPILLMYVGCINWYFCNKTLFLWLKRPYFHFTDTGVYYLLLNIMVDTDFFINMLLLYFNVHLIYQRVFLLIITWKVKGNIFGYLYTNQTYIFFFHMKLQNFDFKNYLNHYLKRSDHFHGTLKFLHTVSFIIWFSHYRFSLYVS
jgi:hypothetical protein